MSRLCVGLLRDMLSESTTNWSSGIWP